MLTAICAAALWAVASKRPAVMAIRPSCVFIDFSLTVRTACIATIFHTRVFLSCTWHSKPHSQTPITGTRHISGKPSLQMCVRVVQDVLAGNIHIPTAESKARTSGSSPKRAYRQQRVQERRGAHTDRKAYERRGG